MLNQLEQWDLKTPLLLADEWLASVWTIEDCLDEYTKNNPRKFLERKATGSKFSRP